MDDDNILIFRRPLIRQVSAAAELVAVLDIYDPLIALLRETWDEGLDGLTDSLVIAVVRCREALASKADEQTIDAMVNTMRADLREIPRTLRSLMPGIGPRLGESIERKLGIQFSRC